MVSVEFDVEHNEVVGKVYDAESQLKYATEPATLVARSFSMRLR
jgi:hypothetical protein